MNNEPRPPDLIASLQALLRDLGVDPASVDRSQLDALRTGGGHLRVTYLDGRQQRWEQEPDGPWMPVRDNPFRVQWTS